MLTVCGKYYTDLSGNLVKLWNREISLNWSIIDEVTTSTLFWPTLYTCIVSARIVEKQLGVERRRQSNRKTRYVAGLGSATLPQNFKFLLSKRRHHFRVGPLIQ